MYIIYIYISTAIACRKYKITNQRFSISSSGTTRTMMKGQTRIRIIRTTHTKQNHHHHTNSYPSSSSSSWRSKRMIFIFLLLFMVFVILFSLWMGMVQVHHHQQQQQEQQQQQQQRREDNNNTTIISAMNSNSGDGLSDISSSRGNNNNNKNSKKQQQQQSSTKTQEVAKSSSLSSSSTTSSTSSSSSSSCAILFFGLPRAYKSIVLPSIVQNIIVPNVPYHCDYYIHTYQVQVEDSSRSGNGGTIYSQDIYQLQQAIENIIRSTSSTSSSSQIHFIMDNETMFDQQYQNLLHKIHTQKDNTTHQYIYFPWKAKTYQLPQTTTNIIKMWHSIQSVWYLMEQKQKIKQQQPPKQYDRIAILRSDVFYLTPIDLYESVHGVPLILESVASTSSAVAAASTKARKTKSISTTAATTKKTSTMTTTTSNIRVQDTIIIPGFAKYPVNDRMIIGPYNAIEIWANQRFALLESHIQYMLQNYPGWGLHEERFLYYTIFPKMIMIPQQQLQQPYTILEHSTMCFVRVRADETIWISDCFMESFSSIIEYLLHDTNIGWNSVSSSSSPRTSTRNYMKSKMILNKKSIQNIQNQIEMIIQRKCYNSFKVRHNVMALNCSSNTS